MATTSNFGWPTPDDTDLVRNGADAIRALGDAVDAYSAGGFLFAGRRIFTGSGAFAKADPLLTGDIGLRAVVVTCVGGGGGGGAAAAGGGQSRAGSGGQGGGYGQRFILASTLDTSESVSVGGGGGSQAQGGNSNFAVGTGYQVVGRGGNGGNNGVNMLPGVGSGFSFCRQATQNNTGGEGDVVGYGTSGGEGYGTRSPNTATGGAGGASIFGGGPSARFTTSGALGGSNAAGVGAGGGGAVSVDSGSGSGGSGATGIVIVDCFV